MGWDKLDRSNDLNTARNNIVGVGTNAAFGHSGLKTSELERNRRIQQIGQRLLI